MSEPAERLPDVVIGERLRIARESQKSPRPAPPSPSNVARTTIVAIEQGQRRVRMNELKSSPRSMARRQTRF